MKNILVIIVFVVTSYSVTSQIYIDKIDTKIFPIESKENASNTNKLVEEVNLDPTYFILGTLSDYMGRFSAVTSDHQVDRYYPYEEILVNYLTTYIASNLNIDVDTIFENSGHGKMFSSVLAKTLNSFYNEDGQLMNDKFITKPQIYSFLTGVYYRNGIKLDSTIYKIQLVNSPKHRNCYKLLKDINCTNIFYKYLQNIPAQFTLYFEPTEKLRQYLKIIEEDRILLTDSFDMTYIEQLKLNKKELEELKEMILTRKEKEIEIIKNAFTW